MRPEKDPFILTVCCRLTGYTCFQVLPESSAVTVAKHLPSPRVLASERVPTLILSEEPNNDDPYAKGLAIAQAEALQARREEYELLCRDPFIESRTRLAVRAAAPKRAPLQVGDLVYLRTTAFTPKERELAGSNTKFAPDWLGPYTVSAVYASLIKVAG